VGLAASRGCLKLPAPGEWLTAQVVPVHFVRAPTAAGRRPL
jgi:hypothetical protein